MSEQAGEDRSIEVRTYFVRGRNALVARADFSRVFVDYYLHVAECGLQLSAEEAEYAKSSLVAVTLHCASRPRNERVAWTVNFQEPLLNVFAAGDNPLGTVVTNVFSEGVRVRDNNLFYADIIRGTNPTQRSVVDFEGSDFFAAAERFYSHSEQRPARFFHHHDDDFVLISAQPDCDVEWMAALDADSVRNLDGTQELALLEQRLYRFECGCNQQRMMRVLLPTFQQAPDVLYDGAEVIRMSCPRCGARHAITRESLEALQKAEGAIG